MFLLCKHVHVTCVFNKLMMMMMMKEVWRYLQPSGYNAPTWQSDRWTDRWTLGDSKDRAYA